MTIPRPFLSVPLVIVSYAFLAACGGDGGATGPDGGAVDPVPTTIVLDVAQTVLFVGETATLQASVRDQFGRPIERAVTWTSEDPTTATVSTQGVVTAADAGITSVTASAAGLTVTSDVHVRFDVARGEIRMRVRGAVNNTWQWSEGFATGFHTFGLGSEEEYTLLPLISDEDTGVIAVWPRGPELGVVSCPQLDLPTIDFSRPQDLPAAVVWVSAGPESVIFTPDGGACWVELDRVEPPLARSYVSGQMSGRIVFEGEGMTQEFDDEGRMSVTPTGEHLSVYGDFSVSYFVEPWASLTSEFIGGPSPGTQEEGTLEVFYEGNSQNNNYRMEYDGRRANDYYSLYVHVTDMAVGAHTIGPGNATNPWFNDWSKGYPWIGGRIQQTWPTMIPIASQSGTVTIDNVVPGQDNQLWGEVRGGLSAVLDVYDAAGVATGEMCTWNLTYHAPVLSTRPSAARSAPWFEDGGRGLLKRWFPGR